MKGIIDFYEWNEDYSERKHVGHAENLITTAGKNAVLRYLAGMTKDYAGAIAVGLDPTTAAVGDLRLGIETARAPVIMRSVDFSTQTITFKASLDQGFAGAIHEMGIIPVYLDEIAGTYSGGIITNFGVDDVWTVSTSGTVTQTEAISAAATRIGSSVLAATISTNSGWIQYDTYKSLDLGGYSPTDQISFGHISATNRLTSLVVTFTDYQGYTATYTQNVTTHTAGDNVAQYNIYRVNKSAFTLSNTAFDWSSVQKVTVRTNGSGSAGTAPNGKGSWDFLGMVDTDTLNVDALLVSRVSNSTALATKTAGKIMDIEYKLVFNF